mmetsp:Transcript_50765/g.127363  ORF Transcript_50765/g.127363 Transcript_50765/m.127363 type:complete len:361 (+) Transcript_50765:169-1251(+)
MSHLALHLAVVGKRCFSAIQMSEQALLHSLFCMGYPIVYLDALIDALLPALTSGRSANSSSGGGRWWKVCDGCEDGPLLADIRRRHTQCRGRCQHRTRGGWCGGTIPLPLPLLGSQRRCCCCCCSKGRGRRLLCESVFLDDGSPLLGLVPLAQVGEHVDGQLGLTRLEEPLRRLSVLPLNGVHLCEDHVFLLLRELLLLAVARLQPRQQVQIPHVANPNERLPGEIELEAGEAVDGEGPPVALGDAEAGDSVSGVEVFAVEVPEHGGRLRHVDSLHGHVVQTKDLGTLEPNNEALELLRVWGEGARLDAQRVVAAVCEHVLHLCVPGDRVGVGLLVDELLAVQVVHQHVGRFVHYRQLFP